MNTMNTKGTTFFTPLDTIEEHLELKVHARLASPVLQSMTWMLNTACTNMATTIMFDLFAARTDEDKPKNLVAYAGNIVDILDRDEVYNGTLDEDRTCEIESNENTLAILLGLRKSWYDLTQAAMLANNSSDEAVNKWLEKNRFSVSLNKTDSKDIDSAQLDLIRFDVKQLTQDPAEIEEMMAEQVAMALIAKEQAATDTLKLAPIKLEILRTVGKHMKHDARFDQLPLRTQAMLTKFCVKSITNAKVDLRERMARREPVAYTHLSLAGTRATRELEYVINSKYNETSDLENNSTSTSHEKLDQARNEKRFACTID